MDDFTLTMNCGYPSQDVIVGGDFDLSPDISSFVGNEEVIFEDLDGGLTSSSDDLGSPGSPGLRSSNEDEIIHIKAESEDEDSDTLSVSLNVDFDKLDRSKSKTKEYVFVTEDGKTAERFEDFGNNDDFCWKEISMESKKKNSFTEASITPSKIQVQNEYTKPKMSYAQLIAEALLTGRERMLTLNEIYIAINKKHPYYSLDASTGRNWQNAIRHNLTLNKAFIKVPRPATEGRGAYWKLELGAETQIFRRMARNYNRPHTAVAKPMGLNSRGHKIFYCDTTDVNTVYIAVPTWLSIKIHAEEKDFIHMYYKIYLKWRFKHH